MYDYKAGLGSTMGSYTGGSRRRTMAIAVTAFIFILILVLSYEIVDTSVWSKPPSLVASQQCTCDKPDSIGSDRINQESDEEEVPTETEEQLSGVNATTETAAEPTGKVTKAELREYNLKKEHRLLRSKRNGMGVYNNVNTQALGMDILNPTLLQLPKGSDYEFLVIARALHVDVEIKGKKYRKARQVAFFANLVYNHPMHPELIAGGWYRLLVDDFLGPEHHCRGEPGMDKYIGPEDMKLFWTRKKEPLLIFTHQTPDENLCEGMFVVDARAIVPELDNMLRVNAPITFDEPQLAHRRPPIGHETEKRYQREKNWAMTQTSFGGHGEELLFMADPGKIYKWDGPGEAVKSLSSRPKSAIKGPYPAGARKTWHSGQTCMHDVMLSGKHVHQSTPMLTLTLCKRGECVPTEANTVMIGMIQRRYDPPALPYTKYERRIAVYRAAPPFDMMSVSKVLDYLGEVEEKYIWTGSMVYHRNENAVDENWSHGYLDDEIWLSFGIKDKAGGFIDIDAKDLIEDHYMCEGATRGYVHSLESNL